MSRNIRLTFLVHAIVAVLFGVVMYLAPTWFATVIQWTPVDPVMTAFMGTALLALGLSSFFAYRAAHWEEVRIVVESEIAFTVLGTLAGLFYLLFAAAPLFTWVPVILWALFAVAWIAVYVSAHRVEMSHAAQ